MKAGSEHKEDPLFIRRGPRHKSYKRAGTNYVLSLIFSFLPRSPVPFLITHRKELLVARIAYAKG